MCLMFSSTVTVTVITFVKNCCIPVLILQECIKISYMRLAWQIAKMIKHVFSISSETKKIIKTYTGNAEFADKLPKKIQKIETTRN